MTQPTEPDRTTAPELQQALKELSHLEEVFHWPPREMSRADLERMTSEEFWEVGASGRQYGKEFTFGELARRQAKTTPDVWETSDYRVQQLCADLFLLTYTLLQDRTRLTRRISIWRRTSDGWKIVFHQGTVVS